MNQRVPRVRPRSKRQIESLSERILDSYKPNLLKVPGRLPVLDFFESYLPEKYELDTGVGELADGIEGLTSPDGQVLVNEETYRNACNSRKSFKEHGRARFTIIHECGHGIMHRNELRSRMISTGKLVLHRRPDLPAFLDPEWQANYFAGALLMPRRAIKVLAEKEKSLLLPEIISDEFGVSYTAAKVRMDIVMGN